MWVGSVFWPIFSSLIGFMIGSLLRFEFVISRQSLKTHQGKGNLELIPQSELYNSNLANDLFDQVKILCMVMTNPKDHKTKAIHVKNTWGKRCNKLLFITSQPDPDLDTIVVSLKNDSRKALRNKTRDAFYFAHDNHFNDFHWFLKADDDSYIIMENVRYMLMQYHSEIALHFGHRINYNHSDTTEGYMAGSCYILSRKALAKFTVNVRKSYKNLFYPDNPGEDLEMGRALAHSVIFVDSRDEKLEKRFFPLGALQHLSKTIELKRYPAWYYDKFYYDLPPTGLGCCSDVSIAFHYIKPQPMYFHEYLVYHVHAFGISKNLTETLPKKLSLAEIVKASDVKSLSPYFINHTDYHNMTSSEMF